MPSPKNPLLHLLLILFFFAAAVAQPMTTTATGSPFSIPTDLTSPTDILKTTAACEGLTICGPSGVGITSSKPPDTSSNSTTMTTTSSSSVQSSTTTNGSIPAPTDTTTSPHSSWNRDGKIIGILLGVLALGLSFVMVLVVVVKRRRERKLLHFPQASCVRPLESVMPMVARLAGRGNLPRR